VRVHTPQALRVLRRDADERRHRARAAARDVDIAEHARVVEPFRVVAEARARFVVERLARNAPRLGAAGQQGRRET
jgi:hypothetical protein